MARNVSIREAVRSDARAIATIHIASWQATYRGHMDDAFLDSLAVDRWTERRERMLAQSDAREQVHVAEVDGEIVGFCSIGASRDIDMPPDTAELYAIYVDPRATQRGIGTALIIRAEAVMHDAGFAAAMLWVLRENVPARAFYERSGWTLDGHEKQDMIGGRALTEVRYRKPLDAAPGRHP